MHGWSLGRTILSVSRPSGSTRIAVTDGRTSYVSLEEASMAG